MSRECNPLYGRPQDRGLKVFIAEGGCSLELGRGGDVDVARYLTVMLNFDTSSVQRFSDFASSIQAVLEHTFTVPWDRLEADKAVLLRAYPPSVVNMVVRLPAKRELAASAELVDSTLESLLGGSFHRTGVVVGLAAQPSDWGGLQHLRHFVAAPAASLDHDAIAVFKVVATMMAPSAILEWDDVDLYEALGCAGSPSLVAHANWQPVAQRLRFSSARDAAIAARAQNAFICTLSASPTLHTASRLMKGWRAHVRQSCDCVFSVTSGFFEPTRLGDNSDQPTRVIAICRTSIGDGDTQ